MGNLRHETYYAGDFLIKQLGRSGVIRKMLHDGGDIILFESSSRQKVSVHLIQSSIEVYEIRSTLESNTARGIHTMFLLWNAMMVPNHGRHYKMDDWMEVFIELSGGRVYAYDQFDSEVYIFSVYFRGGGPVRLVEFGTTVRAGHLTLESIMVNLPDLTGEFMVARFGTAPYTSQETLSGTVPLTELEACYALLGVAPDDDVEALKRAYRLLARRYHPDTNPDPDAHEMMQRVNEAYQKILDAMN
jgi:hypothetical protein